MKRALHPSAAFSLVELTLAIGVAAFCLIAVFGLMPVGVQTNRNATSQTAATNIVAAVVTDLRATPSASITTQYRITFGTSKTLFFDGAGECSVDVNGSTKLDGSSWSPPLQTRCQLNITFPPNEGFTHSPTYANLKVTWPAAATPANASGSIEMFAAFDRN
jgi:uncharacterized protein (TIGR02598 family)